MTARSSKLAISIKSRVPLRFKRGVRQLLKGNFADCAKIFLPYRVKVFLHYRILPQYERFTGKVSWRPDDSVDSSLGRVSPALILREVRNAKLHKSDAAAQALLEEYASNVDCLENTKTATALLGAVEVLGADRINQNAELLRSLNLTDRSSNFRRARLLLMSPEHRDSALSVLNDLLDEIPDDRPVLQVLANQAKQSEDWKKAELLFGRLFWLAKSPAIGYQYCSVLLHRKKPIQADVVAKSIAPETLPRSNPLSKDMQELLAELVQSFPVTISEEKLQQHVENISALTVKVMSRLDSLGEKDCRHLLAALDLVRRIEGKFRVVRRFESFYAKQASDESAGTLNVECLNFQWEALIRVQRSIVERAVPLCLNSDDVTLHLSLPRLVDRALDVSKFTQDTSCITNVLQQCRGRFKHAEWLHHYELAYKANFSEALPEDGTSVHWRRLERWGDFTHAARLKAVNELPGQRKKGVYFYNDSRGKIAQADCVVSACSIQLAQGPVRIVAGELIEAADTTLLHPGEYHVKEYPRPNPLLLTTGNKFCAFSEITVQRSLDVPVIVLGNMDGVSVPNYYHWMALILSRICYLAEQNEFSERKLCIPREIRPWMSESLRLAGFTDERIVYVASNESVELTDAVVVSPIDTPSEEALECLRKRLFDGAGLQPKRTSTSKNLLIMRDDVLGRRMFEEGAFRELAKKRGFIEIAPGRLSVAEQLEVFSSARSIAGMSGAAFMNAVFSPSGAKVLAATKREAFGLEFAALSILRDQEYRWLLGDNMPLDAWHGIVNAHYHVDKKCLEDGLGWCCG